MKDSLFVALFSLLFLSFVGIPLALLLLYYWAFTKEVSDDE